MATKSSVLSAALMNRKRFVSPAFTGASITFTGAVVEISWLAINGEGIRDIWSSSSSRRPANYINRIVIPPFSCSSFSSLLLFSRKKDESSKKSKLRFNSHTFSFEHIF